MRQDPPTQLAATHPDLAELDAFARGQELTSQQSQRIESHLAQCPACRNIVGDVAPDQFMQFLRSVGGRSPAIVERRLVDGYQIIERLGEGGAGVVYRARQPSLQRDVALKLLKSGIGSSDLQLKRWRNELRSLAALDHPNIVQIHDAGEQSGTPFLAMEFVAGPTLAQQLESGPLSAVDAVGLTGQIAAAIQFAHERGVVHRDLKPGNVLLHQLDGSSKLTPYVSPLQGTPYSRFATSLGVAKIVDFGLSRWLGEEGQTQTGDALGTPSYMAPEQVRGANSEIGPATDVYGIGAILYECLTGRPPFRGASAMETMQLVLNHDLLTISRLRAHVTADLEAICLKCLEKDPLRRYSSAAQVCDDLLAFMDGRPVSAKRPGTCRRTYLWIRRNPWLASFAGLFSLALAGGIAALLWHQQTLSAERALAHRHYAEARATISKMLETAQSHSSLDIPKLNEMSMAQAEQALELFERLADEEQTTESTLELAKVRMTLGTLAATLGQTKRGEEQLRLAVNSLQQLGSLVSESPATMAEITTAQIKLAVIWTNNGRADDALSLLNRAKPICERILAADPSNPNWLSHLAWLHHSIAGANVDLHKTEMARDEYQIAVKYRQSAFGIAPSSELRRLLIESRLNLAQCQSQLGELESGRKEFKSAIAELDADLQHNSADVGILTSRGIAYLNLGNLEAALDSPHAAVEACEQGLVSTQKAREAEPNNLIARDTLFRLLGNRAMYRMQDQQSHAAVDDWRKAIELATDEDSANYCRTMLIRCLAMDEQFDAAEQAALAYPPDDTKLENQFRLAAAWGYLSWSARKSNAALSNRCGEKSSAVCLAMVANSPRDALTPYQSLIESMDDFYAVRELTSVDQRAAWFGPMASTPKDEQNAAEQ